MPRARGVTGTCAGSELATSAAPAARSPTRWTVIGSARFRYGTRRESSPHPGVKLGKNTPPPAHVTRQRPTHATPIRPELLDQGETAGGRNGRRRGEWLIPGSAVS